MCRAEEKQGSSNGKSSCQSRNEGPQYSIEKTNKDNIPSYKNCIIFQQMPVWIILTVLMKEFSINLPHWISQAGRETFVPAKYKYDATNTLFDNTILVSDRTLLHCEITFVFVFHKACILWDLYSLNEFCCFFSKCNYVSVSDIRYRLCHCDHNDLFRNQMPFCKKIVYKLK